MKSQAEVRTPRERYRDELRKSILDAAREAFAQDGYDGVSMRKVAERVGCSHGNLYLHFKDKDALFDALVAESFDRFGEGLHRMLASVPKADPVELVRKAGRAYVQFGVENPNVYEFAFILRRPGQEGRPHHVTYDRVR